MAQRAKLYQMLSARNGNSLIRNSFHFGYPVYVAFTFRQLGSNGSQTIDSLAGKAGLPLGNVDFHTTDNRVLNWYGNCSFA